MNNFKSNEHLSEAVMLLNYLNVAKSHENFEIPVEQNEIDNWISHLDAIINYEIDLRPESSRLCDLYILKGNFLHFFSNKSNSISSLKDSIEKSINWYEKIVPELPLVPLFSIDKLLFLLNIKLKNFLNFRDLELNRLEKLICEIEDYYIQKREKDFDRQKDRAISYFEKQRYYDALSILHRLNIETQFFERLYFNTLIKLVIADCYRIMGLSYASLRYSLLAMSQVIENAESKNELLKLLPRALMSSINSCKIQGNWILQMFYIRAYFICQSEFVGYYNANQEEDENEIFNQMVNIFFVNEKFNCVSKTKLKSIFPLDLDFYNQVVQGVKESRKIFNKVSKNQLLKQLKDQMIDYPFNDFNKKRTTVWNAFGIEWSICFRMDYDIFFKVERFASFFQIFLAELTDIDLCLPFNLKVILNFSQNENSVITINRAHKNNIQVWDIYITDKFNNQEELQFLQISSTVILELSLLKGEKILSTIKEGLLNKSKLAEKLNLNKDISFLREILIPKKYFDTTFENSKMNKPFDFKTNLDTILHPLTCLGITYNKENNLIQISNRYRRIIQCNKYTLLDLIKEPSVQITIKRFKSEGYLDWHILACIFNSKINYLVNELRKKGLPIEYCLQEGIRLAEMPEEMHSKIVIPKTEFTYEKLKKELKTYVPETLQSYDLEFKNESPRFEAIEGFLTQRYNFKKDDVPHPNYWQGEGLA